MSRKRRISVDVPEGCILTVDGVEFVANRPFTARVEEAQLSKPAYMAKEFYRARGYVEDDAGTRP